MFSTEILILHSKTGRYEPVNTHIPKPIKVKEILKQRIKAQVEKDNKRRKALKGEENAKVKEQDK